MDNNLYADEDDSVSVTQIRRGVMMSPIDPKKPLWIVEEILNYQEVSMVACYNIQKASLKRYKQTNNANILVKSGKYYRVNKDPFNNLGESELAKIVRAEYNKNSKDKQARVYIPDKPIFIAPLIVDTDTFNGTLGVGFFEREPVKPTIIGNKQVYERGRATGVFLSTDRISWLETKVDKAKLIDSLKPQIASMLDVIYPDSNVGGTSIEQ